MRTGFVERNRMHSAILSISGVYPARRIMDLHLSQAEFSRTVVTRANHLTVVADHSKFAVQAAVEVFGIAEVDTLATCRPPPTIIAQRLAGTGTKVMATE